MREGQINESSKPAATGRRPGTASASRAIEDRGNGDYRVQDLSLYMPGSWWLRLAFTGAVVDRAAVVVQVR